MRRGGRNKFSKQILEFLFFFEICKNKILEINWTNSRNLANFFFWENENKNENKNENFGIF